MTTIDVTQEDITKGERGSCWRCPIVLAVHRVLEADYVGVAETLRLQKRGVKSLNLKLPDEAWDFVNIFDEGAIVAPFTFQLEIPKEFLK